MDTRDKMAAIGLGALGGGVAGFLAWMYMKQQVDAQVTASVDAAVDQQVRAELQTLGITPAVAAQLRTTMQNLSALGVFSSLAQGTTAPTSSTPIHGYGQRQWR